MSRKVRKPSPTLITVSKRTDESKIKKRIKGNFRNKSPTKFQSENERFFAKLFWSLKREGINIIMMKFDSGLGIGGVEFEGMERNEQGQRS